MYRLLSGSMALVMLLMLLVGCSTRGTQTGATSKGPKVAGTQQTTNRVTVTLNAKGLTLSPSSVPAGNITFAVVNNTKTARTIIISGEYTTKHVSNLRAGQTKTVDITNAKAGSYKVYVQGMQSKTGMQKTLTVTSGAKAMGTTSTIDVTLNNTGLSVSPNTATAGKLAFRVKNNSNAPETLVISGQGITERVTNLAPTQEKTVVMSNAKPGSYQIYVQGKQSQASMKKAFTVTAASVAGTKETASRVNVALTSSGLTVSPKTVEAGAIIFDVKNDLTTAHTIIITGQGTTKKVTNLTAGKPQTVQMTNVKPGKYRIYVEGQQKRTGMQQTLTVTKSETATTSGKAGAAQLVTVRMTNKQITFHPSTLPTSDNITINIANSSNAPKTILLPGGQKRTLQPNSTASIHMTKTGTNQYTVSWPGS